MARATTSKSLRRRVPTASSSDPSTILGFFTPRPISRAMAAAVVTWSPVTMMTPDAGRLRFGDSLLHAFAFGVLESQQPEELEGRDQAAEALSRAGEHLMSGPAE